MQKKKTLLILIWNMDIGGVQKRVRDIVVYMNKHYPHWKIELVVKKAYPTPLLKQVQKIRKINIRFFNKSPKKTYGLSFFWLAKQYLSIKPNIALTFLDRLSVQMAALKLLFYWHKVRLVLNEGIYTSTYLTMYENPIWEKLVKIFYPLADKIIVPTKTIQKDLVKNFNVSSKKIAIIPHWNLKIPKGSPKEKYDFIYLGRIEKEKNISVLLKLVKYLKAKGFNPRLCILGKGTLENQLQLKIKYLRLTKNVFFYGFKQNVDSYLTKAKILLLPSLNEGMPNCVLEAASHKVPSIVYNFKGAGEVIINKKTGFIAKTKKDFLKKAEKLLKDESRRKKMGTSAYRNTLKSFGEKNLKRFIDILTN